MRDTQIVREVPGLYGSIKVDEKTIQKIWAEQNFNQLKLKTELGKKLKILSPGTWNQSEEGPDFKNAHLLLDRKEIRGDVEIHFLAEDWFYHQHHKDPNYNRVILHVTLFPPKEGAKLILTRDGKNIPQLSLLPYLRQSLEELLEAETVELLAGYKSTLPINFQSTGILEEIKNQNYQCAQDRWLQKKAFARRRLAQGNQEEVFHQCILEVLGYKRNRVQMSQLAQSFPTAYWKDGGAEPKEVFDSVSNWKIRGLRPANHPRIRLEQYAQLWKKNPNWIESLSDLNIPGSNTGKVQCRKSLEIAKLNTKWKNTVMGGVWGGTRINTLWIDACLPLLSEIKQVDYFETWFFWYAGDFPRILHKITQEAKIAGHSNNSPFSNGTLQGVFGYCIKNQIFG
ncbi:MAG: DUF2851 family protein [Opitutae bacterium]|nr:DUF2851 family protein [Opitutae bacterium]